jgi:hypothetical protein
MNDATRVLQAIAALHEQLLAGSGTPEDTDPDDLVGDLLAAVVAALDLAGAALVVPGEDGPRVVGVPETLAATQPAQLPDQPGAGAVVVREDGRLVVALQDDGQAVGSLSLYAAAGRPWSEPDQAAATALAAIVGSVLGAAARLEERARTVAQLQAALDSRVVIEQAKGVVAARDGVGVDEAFEAVRAHARSHHVTVRAVSEAIVHLGLRLDAPGQPGHPGEPGEPGGAGPAPG